MKINADSSWQSGIWLALIPTLFLMACERVHTDHLPRISILSPCDGAYFMQQEPIFVSVKVSAPGGYESMQLYLDEHLLAESMEEKIHALLLIPPEGADSHQLHVKARYNGNESLRATRIFHLIKTEKEVGNLESFQVDAPGSWFLCNWQVADSEGSHHGAKRNIPGVAWPVSVGIYLRPIRKF